MKTLAHFCCCNIFQESFKNVAMLPQNVVRKHLHHIMATFIHVVQFYDVHNVVATFLQYDKIRVDHIRTYFRKKNKNSKWPTKRSHNVPRTLWNVGLSGSLVNVPKTCQQRCEINIYALNKYLFHNIVSTLSQRYAVTHLSNVV